MVTTGVASLTTSAAVAAAAPVSGARAFLTQGDIDQYKVKLDTWAARQLVKYDSSVVVSTAMDSKHGGREDYAKHLQDIIRNKHAASQYAAERIGNYVPTQAEVPGAEESAAVSADASAAASADALTAEPAPPPAAPAPAAAAAAASMADEAATPTPAQGAEVSPDAEESADASAAAPPPAAPPAAPPASTADEAAAPIPTSAISAAAVTPALKWFNTPSVETRKLEMEHEDALLLVRKKLDGQLLSLLRLGSGGLALLSCAPKAAASSRQAHIIVGAVVTTVGGVEWRVSK